MITSWNKSFTLPETLAESISGYNRYTDDIYILGGWNGTHETSSLYTFDPVTNEFTVQYYTTKIAISVSSYTWVRDAMFFTNNFTLKELTMTYHVTYEPRLFTKGDLPSTHYAANPSITTDQQKYLFITGGVVDGSVVSTLSIYDIEQTNWKSISTPNMKYPRLGHNCIARNNYLYAFGGYTNNSHTTNKIEKLYIGDIDNIDTESWQVLNSTLSNDIAYMRIAESDGLLYIIGGYSETLKSSVKSVDVLNPANDEISSGVQLSHMTNRGAITQNINGNIYLFGGYGNSTTLALWQWSNSDVNSTNLLQLYITIASAVSALVIALILYKFYKCYCKRSTGFKEINRALSYDGAGEEGKFNEIAALAEYESISKYVMDTSFKSDVE